MRFGAYNEIGQRAGQVEELERIVLEVLAVKPVWRLGELETAVMQALGRSIDGPLYAEVLTTLQARRLVTIKGRGCVKMR